MPAAKSGHQVQRLIVVLASLVVIVAGCSTSDSTGDTAGELGASSTAPPDPRPFDGPAMAVEPAPTLTGATEVTRFELPPALAIYWWGETSAMVLADDQESIDALLGDGDAMDELLEWASVPFNAGRGPYDTWWAGSIFFPSRPAVLRLATEGPLAGCTDRWISFIGPDGENVRVAPGFCVGGAARGLLHGVVMLELQDGWLKFDGANRPGDHRSTITEDELPGPRLEAEFGTYAANQVPPGATATIIPEPGARRTEYEAWPHSLEWLGDLQSGAARSLCLGVFVVTGDGGTDDRVEVAIDVYDIDGAPIETNLVVEPVTAPHTRTLFSVDALDRDGPSTVTVTAVDGQLLWWALAARGC